jgi:hypothetical protein
MKTLDLGKQQVTVDELLNTAAIEAVLIRSNDGHSYVLEAADSFEQEIAQLAASEKFMSFLGQRSEEPASISLSDIERQLTFEES